ncbi:MAG: hypothetical protein V4463_12035 [Pseudomonadota bacterium]
MIHAALLLAWLQARHALPAVRDASTMLALRWFEDKPPARLPTPEVAPVHKAAPARPQRPAPAAAPASPSSVAPALPDPFDAPAPAPPNTMDNILQQARRDIGKIDRDLRRASPSKIHAPAESPAARLAAGIEEATRPPRWYEPAKIIAIADQGGYDRRMYKVITFKGTYCVTYESNHAPDGIDPFKHGPIPKLTNCPREK